MDGRVLLEERISNEKSQNIMCQDWGTTKRVLYSRDKKKEGNKQIK